MASAVFETEAALASPGIFGDRWIGIDCLQLLQLPNIPGLLKPITYYHAALCDMNWIKNWIENLIKKFEPCPLIVFVENETLLGVLVQTLDQTSANYRPVVEPCSNSTF